jgi:hypothetical protein
MEYDSQKNAGSRGTGSDKVEWNVRNWLNKDISDGHKVPDLRALSSRRSEKVN